MNNREMALQMIPKGVKTILDIGCNGNYYKKYDTTTLDCIEQADVFQDLNKNQILPFEDNSFDLVVANQILEHLTDVRVLISEIKRVAKKYIFIGFPNEKTWKARIKFIFGKTPYEGYYPYGHKHTFTIRTIEEFILKFFGRYNQRRYWGAFGWNWIPNSIKNCLKNNFPTLFATQVYYLIGRN